MSSSSLCSNMSKSNPLSAAAVQPAAPAALSDLQQAKAAFLNSELSSSYGYQGWLEQHWWAEVGARFGPGQHYLDYTGERCCCSCRLPGMSLSFSYISMEEHRSKQGLSASNA